MVNFNLIAENAYEDLNEIYDQINISSVSNLSIVSIACSDKDELKLSDELIKSFGFQLPKVGMSSFSKDKKTIILGLQPNQFFILFEQTKTNAITYIKNNIDGDFYFTDQSDSWATIKISGEKSRAALERICPIDLNKEKFKVGQIARTTMEHIGTIIYRNTTDEFLLISPRSSAKSFLHAVEVSIKNVL